MSRWLCDPSICVTALFVSTEVSAIKYYIWSLASVVNLVGRIKGPSLWQFSPGLSLCIRLGQFSSGLVYIQKLRYFVIFYLQSINVEHPLSLYVCYFFTFNPHPIDLDVKFIRTFIALANTGLQRRFSCFPAKLTLSLLIQRFHFFNKANKTAGLPISFNADFKLTQIN